jgi:hypothetical protein
MDSATVARTFLAAVARDDRPTLSGLFHEGITWACTASGSFSERGDLISGDPY